MPGCVGGLAGAACEDLGLSPGHGPGQHLQLRPHPGHLPHRGQRLLQQGHQIWGEEFREAHCAPCQGEGGGLDSTVNEANHCVVKTVL